MKRIACMLVPYLLVGPAVAQERLEPGTPVHGSIEWGDEPWEGFFFEVPRDALAFTASVRDAPVGLALFARQGRPMEDYEEDPDHAVVPDDVDGELVVTRTSDPPLEAGTWYLDVVYLEEDAPRVGKRELESVPFTIDVQVVRAKVDGQLQPGVPAEGRTEPAGAWIRSYVVEVPAGVEALRVDLDQVRGELDLRIRHGAPIVDPADAHLEVATDLGRETLTLDAKTSPPLAPGLWYVDVFDYEEFGTTPFSIVVSFGRDPPASLLAIPAFPEPTDGLDRAVLATVSLSWGEFGGSGTLVTPGGLILTNWHVVSAGGGALVPEGEIVVSVTDDPRQPALELFRAKVVESDPELDLALVQVVSGLFGQPLPTGYRFPHLELGDPARLRIDGTVRVLGFPGAAGGSITCTRGIVSGFEPMGAGYVIKTDAELLAGNSGGAAVDEEFRLVAVPTASSSDWGGNGQIGFLHPVSLIPEGWRAKINAGR